MHYLLLPGRKVKTDAFRARMIFIEGDTNYKLSILKNHENTEMHKRAIREKELEDSSKSSLQIKQK